MGEKIRFGFDNDKQVIDLAHSLPASWGGIDAHLRATQDMKEVDRVAPFVAATFNSDLFGSCPVVYKAAFDAGDLFFDQLRMDDHEFSWGDTISGVNDSAVRERRRKTEESWSWSYCRTSPEYLTIKHDLKAVRKGEKLPSAVIMNGCGAADLAYKSNFEFQQGRRKLLLDEAKRIAIQALSNGYKGYILAGTLREEEEWARFREEPPYIAQVAISYADNTATLTWFEQNGGTSLDVNPIVDKLEELKFVYLPEPAGNKFLIKI